MRTPPSLRASLSPTAGRQIRGMTDYMADDAESLQPGKDPSTLDWGRDNNLYTYDTSLASSLSLSRVRSWIQEVDALHATAVDALWHGEDGHRATARSHTESVMVRGRSRKLSGWLVQNARHMSPGKDSPHAGGVLQNALQKAARRRT
jgi:hypothetical protein